MFFEIFIRYRANGIDIGRNHPIKCWFICLNIFSPLKYLKMQLFHIETCTLFLLLLTCLLLVQSTVWPSPAKAAVKWKIFRWFSHTKNHFFYSLEPIFGPFLDVGLTKVEITKSQISAYSGPLFFDWVGIGFDFSTSTMHLCPNWPTISEKMVKSEHLRWFFWSVKWPF